MKSSYVGLSGGNCGLGDNPLPANDKTIRDTVDEAKKYTNTEIPVWVKIAAGIATVYGLSKLTKTSE